MQWLWVKTMSSFTVTLQTSNTMISIHQKSRTPNMKNLKRMPATAKALLHKTQQSLRWSLILSFHIKFSHIPHISLTYPWILESQQQKCLFCVVFALQVTVFYWQSHKQQKFSNKTTNNAQITVTYLWHIPDDFHISRQMWKL